MKNKGLDRYDIKIANRKMILGILEAGTQLSRVQLARHTGMSATSMTRIISELLSQNFLIETDGVCHGKGRRSTILSINPDVFCVLGVSFGRKSLRLCIMNFGRQILFAADYPQIPKHSMTADTLATYCSDCAEQFLTTVCIGFDRSLVKYAGFAFPGPVDVQKQEIIASPSFTIDGMNQLQSMLSAKLKLPVYIENDVRASLINEYCRYESNKSESIAFIAIDDGLGCSFLYHGELLRGVQSVAGEISRIRYPTERTDLKKHLQLCNDFVMSPQLLENCHQKGLAIQNVQELATLYIGQNNIAKAVIDDFAIDLACLLNTLICVYNPQKIILGGSTVRTVPFILDLVKQHDDLFFAGSLETTNIAISKEPFSEPLAGAAVLAVQSYRNQLLENVCSGE